jgi:hypothetical protein
MFRIDHPTRAAALPSPEAVATQGFFTRGNPSTSTPATVVTDDWLNAVQEEIANVIEGVGGILDKGARTQLVSAVSRIAALGSYGNVLANPDFRIWQRFGPTPSATVDDVLSFDGPDRWLTDAGGTGAVASLSRQSILPATEIPPSGALQVLRFNKTTAGAAGDALLVQRVENVRTYQGQKVVVAFDARKQSGADLVLLGVDLVQRFGSGGSSDVSTALTFTTSTTIDGTFRRFVAVGVLPTISGKVIGASGDNLELRVRFTGAVVFDVYLTGFTLSAGIADPGFVARTLPSELELCRRYFEKSVNLDTAVTSAPSAWEGAVWDTGLDSSATVETLARQYRVPKYPGSTRTLNWYDLAGAANAITRASGTSHAVSAITAAQAGNHVAPPTMTSPPAGGTLNQYRANWACESEIP